MDNEQFKKEVCNVINSLHEEQTETNKLLRTLILKQNTVHVSAISESEYHARKWDVDSETIEEVQANLPPKQSHEEFVKRMETELNADLTKTGEKISMKIANFLTESRSEAILQGDANVFRLVCNDAQLYRDSIESEEYALSAFIAYSKTRKAKEFKNEDPQTFEKWEENNYPNL